MVVAAATTSPWRPTSARAQKLVLLPGHFDAYVKDFDAASEAAAPPLVPGAPRLELDRRWLSLPDMKTVGLEEVEPDGVGR
jgi:hypothetical protein